MQFLILAALIAVAVAETAYPAYPSNSVAYDKSSDDYVGFCTRNMIKTYIYKGLHFIWQAPQPYSYSYAVKDEASYNDYSHSESSDGKVVTGSYSVALPDGRTQVVTYKADSYGYVADVKYIGEAKYPEYKPSSYSPSYESPSYPTSDPTY
uniref:Putative Cuticle protein n=1 Tax=Daphnia magna TaxID=35525 RepID=A0A0P5A401_9CRUS